MEDTHVWVINADGTGAREVAGGVDNRQGAPEWTADGRALLFTVQERGNVRLYRAPVSGGKPEASGDRTRNGRRVLDGEGRDRVRATRARPTLRSCTSRRAAARAS